MEDYKNYYEVIAKCGHVGKRKYIPIKFGVIAETAEEAAFKTRYFPRVKHGLKSAILKVTKIDKIRYIEIREANKNDPYLNGRCKRDNLETGDLINERIENYLYSDKKRISHKEYRFERVIYKNKKNKEFERCFIKEAYYENNY